MIRLFSFDLRTCFPMKSSIDGLGKPRDCRAPNGTHRKCDFHLDEAREKNKTAYDRLQNAFNNLKISIKVHGYVNLNYNFQVYKKNISDFVVYSNIFRCLLYLFLYIRLIKYNSL